MAEPSAAKTLSKAEAAKAVKRRVPEIKDGKPTGEEVERAITVAEVFDFAVVGKEVVVVTVDGQKLRGAL